MSRILFSLLIIFFFYSSSAQFIKGNILIGGNFSYSSYKSTSSSNSNELLGNGGNFDLSLGKAIKGNALLGINISYGGFLNTYIDRSTMKSYNYGIGVFYRVYKDLGKEFYLFGQAGGQYDGSTFSTADSTGYKFSTGTGNQGSIYISPGIAYKISKKFFLELSIPQIFSVAYTSSNSKSGSVSSGTNDNFGVTANLITNPLNSLGIGFRLVL